MKHNWAKLDHTSNNKVKLSRKNIVIIDEEWFGDTNLTDDAIFLMAMTIREKSRFNQK